MPLTLLALNPETAVERGNIRGTFSQTVLENRQTPPQKKLVAHNGFSGISKKDYGRTGNVLLLFNSHCLLYPLSKQALVIGSAWRLESNIIKLPDWSLAISTSQSSPKTQNQ